MNKSKKPDRRHHELLEQLKTTWIPLLMEAGLTEEMAENYAEKAVTKMALLFGGMQIYLPQDKATLILKRNQEIVKRKEKESATVLAREYGLSEKTIYEIVKSNYKTQRHNSPLNN